ncbi:hypothetical protein MAPG_09897 [Magnaporthiopsis poae ATCC 64411]|uniref:Uncharacterized protein n=1 Tax=Magnaporthiopsis poae (strain ATCC 64411 / 73-15) TaxID=644358 RepID=A0A0C4EB51_MAGP6|nr:hypothetical protein MAPG_09897 [Magnaporthiopsis poae ATCC 64411]
MMAELERSRQGDYMLGKDNCIEYDDLAKGESVWGPAVERILHQWSSTHLPNVGALKSVYDGGDDAEADKPETSSSTTPTAAGSTGGASEAADKSMNGAAGDDEEWNGISDPAAPTGVEAEEKATS